MDKKHGGFALTIVEKMGKGKGTSKPAYDEEESSESPDEEKQEEESGADDDKMAQESAAGDLMAAMKSGDKAGFLEAFKALSEMCQGGY